MSVIPSSEGSSPEKSSAITNKSQFTQHAQAEREHAGRVKEQHTLLASVPHLAEVADAMLNYVLILNTSRQIVFASQNIAALADVEDLSTALGLRPGEALGCVHADTCSGGCGTSRACRECGAINAILSGLQGEGKTEECRFTRVRSKRRESLDLRVRSTPLSLAGEKFVILSIADISHEKRRKQLEEIFLHDLIRDAFSLDNFVRQHRNEIVAHFGNEDLAPLYGQVGRLIERILYQHNLAEAENDALTASFTRLESYNFLLKVKADHDGQAAASGVEIHIDPLAAGALFYSDRVLLQRAMGSLVVNAIEASIPGDAVEISAKVEGQTLQFRVLNKGVMSESVSLQLFNRSFSTKSPSRGLGAYTARLLTEAYLSGKIHFTSSKESGTTFFVEIPLRPESVEDEDAQ